MRLVLASASPRRAELLRAADIDFDVQPAHVDERVRDGEPPDRYVVRVAEDKARAVSARFPGRVVLAADTTVVVGDQILGKPDDRDDARRMLRLLSGRSHEVLTGICLTDPGLRESPPRARYETRIARTRVEFLEVTEEELDWYVSTGEPMDKAGAYAIQGLASRFVARIEGSYSNVVGLPVALVWQMLKSIGR